MSKNVKKRSPVGRWAVGGGGGAPPLGGPAGPPGPGGVGGYPPPGVPDLCVNPSSTSVTGPALSTMALVTLVKLIDSM